MSKRLCRPFIANRQFRNKPCLLVDAKDSYDTRDNRHRCR